MPTQLPLRFLFSVLPTALLVASVTADVVIEKRHVMETWTNHHTESIKGDRVRTDTSQAKEDASVILDTKTGASVHLSHAEKTFWKGNSANGKEFLDVLRKHIKDVPEDPKVAKRFLKKEQIGEWECELYEANDEGLEIKSWVTKDIQDYAAIRAERVKVIVAEAKALGFEIPKEVPDEGIIVRQEVSTPLGMIVTTLVKVATQPLPDSLFEPPGDYREVPFSLPPFSEAPERSAITQKWQSIALRLHPELGKASSPFNSKFLALHKQKEETGDATELGGKKFFNRLDWPLLLATEVASGRDPLLSLRTPEALESEARWRTALVGTMPLTVAEFVKHAGTYGGKSVSFPHVVFTGRFGNADLSRDVFVLKDGQATLQVNYERLGRGLGVPGSTLERAWLRDLPNDFSRDVFVYGRAEQRADGKLELVLRGIRIW